MGSPETVFGMSLATYTLLHVLISLVGIASGFVVLFGLVAGKRLEGWTALFLATTVATSVTGFGFPFDHLLPSHKVGFISLVVLAVAIAARYAFHMRGAWRRVYVVSAVLALYLNVFVGVVQSFLKIPALNALAPKQTEPPFVVSQGIVFVLFVVLAIVAAIRFRAETAGAGPGAR
jgi:glucose-6-phosphate-specific signal transduction histidine kinase